jgi:RecB family exonuclease
VVRCGHPAVEPEAIAGELLAARGDGVAWSDMAVLVRRPAQRGRAVIRALSRHGIPVVPLPRIDAREPAVEALIDMLRWVHGDGSAVDRLLVSPISRLTAAEARAVSRDCWARSIRLEDHARLAALIQLRDDLRARAAHADLSELAFEVWCRALAHLVSDSAADDGSGGDNRALDALVAFFDALARAAEAPSVVRPRRSGDEMALLESLDDEPWRAVAPVGDDAVTVTSITSAAGQQWDMVVVAGCVEGELPRIPARTPLFDPAVLSPSPLPSVVERRRRSLAGERRLFSAVACTRATGRLVATAAPEPGVLLSRFVEAWPERSPALPLAPGRPPVVRPATAGAVPVVPQGHLRLSASQLATYDDCPLRYAYEYAVGLRGDAGVHAGLGSLVHQVLAEFLDPSAPQPPPRTRAALLALGEARWRDDIARYRPQVEEARSDFFEMLDAWWEGEGSLGELAPKVLAVERRFDVAVGPHRLTGCIDRIDRADDGHGIRIVDYKTGAREPARDAVHDDIQLAVYHLAATLDPELAAWGPPTQLRLLYLRTMHTFDQEIGADHARATTARVLGAADRIVAEEFEPSVEATCRICSFHRLCPLQPEGRQLPALAVTGAP